MQQLEYSQFDREWLVLPAALKEFAGGKFEYFAILYWACFESPEYFKIDKAQFDLYNTLYYGF